MSIKYEEHARDMSSLKRQMEERHKDDMDVLGFKTPKSMSSTGGTFMPKEYEEMI